MPASNMPTVSEARAEMIQGITRLQELHAFLYGADEAFAAAVDDVEIPAFDELGGVVPVLQRLDFDFADKASRRRPRKALRGLDYDRFDETGRRV